MLLGQGFLQSVGAVIDTGARTVAWTEKGSRISLQALAGPAQLPIFKEPDPLPNSTDPAVQIEMSTAPVSTTETVEACCSVIRNADTGKAELFFFNADTPEEQSCFICLPLIRVLQLPPRPTLSGTLFFEMRSSVSVLPGPRKACT